MSSIYRAFLVADNNNTKQHEEGIDNKGYENNNSEKVPSEPGSNLQFIQYIFFKVLTTR